MKFEIKTKIGDYEFVKEFKNEKILKETLEEYESLKLMIPKILNIIEQNKYKNKTVNTIAPSQFTELSWATSPWMNAPESTAEIPSMIVIIRLCFLSNL